MRSGFATFFCYKNLFIGTIMYKSKTNRSIIIENTACNFDKMDRVTPEER